MKNLVLIGMPGSGKSKMGRLLAERFSLPLVDTDQLVERRAERSVSELFAALGEAGFRDLETAAVREAAALPGAVISTGGGVVLREENRLALSASGLLFFRDRDPEAILTEDHSRRPLLQGPDAREKLLALYAQRLPLYRAWADYIIPHTDTYEAAAEQIAALYEKEVSLP